MKDNLKEIKAGIGLGQLKFGMSRDEVKKLLGEPDEIESYSYAEEDQDLTESWHYDELELSLGFDGEEDWKLTTISVTSDFYELKNKRLMGLSKEDLLTALSELDFADLDIDDWESDDNTEQTLISSDSFGMGFWVEDGFLIEIQWNPLFSDEDTIVWPE